MTPEELDQNRIYAKTAAGEDAMQQRTLVVQRNLRMVLILVDGNATVAELCNKTNQPEMTCNALCELENDGFIEARVENESVWTPERRRARQDDLAADEVSEFSSFGDKYGTEPDFSPVKRFVPPISGSLEVSTGILFGTSQEASPNSRQPIAGRSGHFAAPDSGTVFLSKAEAVSVGDVAPTLTAGESSLLDNFGFFSKRRLEKEGPDLKPIKRKVSHWHLGWPLIVPLAALFLAVLTALVALLFPYAHYLPALEAAIAQTTGQPVKIGSMRATFYPKPGLLLDHVQFGPVGEHGLAIGELRLLPALSSLWQTQLVLNAIEFRAWTFSAQSIDQLGSLLAAMANNPDKPLIEQIFFEKSEISFAGLGIPDLHGQIKLTSTGVLQSLSLTSSDHSLQFDATPEANGLAVRIQALDWLPSKDSGFRFNALDLRGRLTGKRLALDNIDFRIFDGSVSGSASLTDQQRASIVGELSFERVNLRKFGEALGIGGQFQGDANGKIRFSAPTQDLAVFATSLTADGSFVISRGSLGDIDFAEAVRRSSSKPVALGGATRFDRLSGAFRMLPMGYRFSQLSLTAGLLHGNGYLNVTRNQQLNGQIAVAIGRNQGSVPIAIGGILSAPLLNIVSLPRGPQNPGAPIEQH